MNSHISSTPQKGYSLRQPSNNVSEDHLSQKQEVNLELNQSKRAELMNKETPQQDSKKNLLEPQQKDSSSQNKKSFGSEDKNNENIEKEEKELRSENQEGKNQRHQSSEQIRESRQNETNQLPVAASKKCFNKQCSSKKIYRKIRSRVEAGKYRFLCKTCYQSYNNNFFCEFCEQLYSNQYDEEDMHKWIGCDSCQRWNHIQCQKKHRFKSLDVNQELKYECLGCSRKSRNFEDVPKKKVQKEETVKPNKIKFQINRQERISIFHKKPESFPHLEPFLQAYNFRLWINDALIRDDLDNLRSSVLSTVYDQEPKKTKKVKLQ